MLSDRPLRLYLEEATDVVGRLRRELSHHDAIGSEPPEPEQRTYDIIVPCFNGRAVVETCLDSLLEFTDSRHPVWIVDDASTDSQVGPLLAAYASRWPHIHYQRLPKNVGFPGAVNAGLAVTRHDVVLLNSDTELSEGWLARLERCLRSDRRIGLVSPLSNNATICSVPQFNQKNLLPPGLSVNDYARWVALTSLRRYPRVPTAVGFCLLVTREVIDAVGVLDTAFGRGYGEEVDWCLRAWARGFESAICDDAFVYHHGEVGFSDAPGTRALQLANERLVDTRWPRYRASVRTWCYTNPLRVQQQRLFELKRARGGEPGVHVAHVVHSFGGAAGTELHTRRIVDGTRGRVKTSVVHPAEMPDWADARVVDDASGALVTRLNKAMIGAPADVVGAPLSVRQPVVERWFAEYLAGTRPDIVHFQHLLGFGSLLLPGIARASGCRVVISLHDYFLLCPEVNLLDAANQRCGRARLERTDACCECLRSKLHQRPHREPADLEGFIGERWPAALGALNSADVIVAPSHFVRRQFERAAGSEIGDRIRVVPHGAYLPRLEPTARGASSHRLRAAFLGSFTVRKGAEVFLQAIALLAGEAIDWKVIGAVEPCLAQNIGSGIEFTGPYVPEQLPHLLDGVDVVILPSICDETYGCTLDEAFGASLPVIAANVGAVGERVDDGVNGLLVPPGDAAALGAAVSRVAHDRALLQQLAVGAGRAPLRTVEENVADYLSLYEELVANGPSASSFCRSMMEWTRSALVAGAPPPP